MSTNQDYINAAVEEAIDQANRWQHRANVLYGFGRMDLSAAADAVAEAHMKFIGDASTTRKLDSRY